jgi:FlaA1/EpsC-like NDP-sugar epimerase
LHQELLHKLATQQIAYERAPITPILGSIGQPQLLRALFSQYPVYVIYHAAAYKHVPMIEYSLKEDLRNNVFDILVLVQIAAKYQVSVFTLIDADQPVRPTNLMGASKRL